MPFGRNAAPPPPPEPEIGADPTAFLIDSSLAQFFLMSTPYIRYMVMLGYTYLHGYKLFPKYPAYASISFKFVSMVFACTGGGILVPIFINSIPVTLSADAYPVAIIASYLLHENFPALREIMGMSPFFKGACIVLYETWRSYVVCKFTAAAGQAIAPSEFEIPMFGPIFCGTITGCGGAFLPLDRGLDPIKKGMTQPMASAFVAATFFHLFTMTDLSNGVLEAKKKAQVIVTCFFIAYNFYTTEWKWAKIKTA